MLQVLKRKELSEQDFKVLYMMNQHAQGHMQENLQIEDSTIIICREDRILGWALLIPRKIDGKWEAHFYVRLSHRRQGVGKQLWDKSKELIGEFLYFRGDGNREFFNSVDKDKGD